MEKQCIKCSKVKPLSCFELSSSGKHRGQCRDCRREQALARYHQREEVAAAGWSAFADDVIRERYPAGGAAACRPFLPDRTVAAINKRASRLGVSAEGYEWSDLPWPLPQQDSAPMHLLFQRAALPVFGSALVGSI